MRILALTAMIVSIAACSPVQRNYQGADYWQRTDAPSQIYLQGPKAQHSLNHDIANCVVEVRELVRLGSIRSATPPSRGSSYLAGFDTPEYDRSEYAAYYDYADFEGCMIERGWQRMAHVPYDVARKGMRNFEEAVYGSSRYDVPDYRDPNYQDGQSQYNN